MQNSTWHLACLHIYWSRFKSLCTEISLKTIQFFGLVLVSTGVLKFGKPSAAPGPRHQPGIKFKRRRYNRLRCLMAAVAVWDSRISDIGIKLSGALFLQSFAERKDFMKLLKTAACHPASVGGNVKRMTVMGDAWMDRLSDAGSIPARSIRKRPWKSLISGVFCYLTT